MQVLEKAQVFPVQFSRVRDEIGKIADDEGIFESRKIVATVGFGYAPVLQPGTIWENGGFRARWPFNQITVDVTVDQQTTIVGPYAQYRVRDGERYFVPAGQFKVDGRVAGSRMALFRATLAGERIILIVPCMEIFRFYYGHSSRLAFRILRGAMASARHWVYDAEASWVDASGLARIELAPTMDVMDGYTVARFVLDPVGLKRATAVVTRAALARRGTLPIDVLPPFNGLWRLRARGKWLSYGQSRAFLVFALVRCEAAVPFRELSVFGGTTYGNWRSRTERKEPSESAKERRRAVAPAASIVALSTDPDVKALRVRLPTLDTDKRFPEVRLHYTFRRRRSRAGSQETEKIKTVPKVVRRVGISDEVAFEGPDSGTFGQAPDVSPELRERRDLLDLFQQMLDALPDLARGDNLDCTVARRLLDFSQVYPGRPPAWTTLGKGSDAFRTLHLATVRLNGLHALVIDVQRRPGTTEQIRTLIVCTTSFNELQNDRLMTLLARIPAHGGHLRDLEGVRSLSDVRLSGTNHLESDTPEQFGIRVLGKIVDLMNDIDAGALV